MPQSSLDVLSSFDRPFFSARVTPAGVVTEGVHARFFRGIGCPGQAGLLPTGFLCSGSVTVSGWS
ncbi:hypothetical protein [Thiohalophilus sp.]|uniref:hypothetical protein n=1 Tax=Thiohalophilus sp. TaxID=3028392 RepID=UPI002ACE9D0F|nr:hypothetical protein [Thiohalophilus sp.]MDZ7803485.1 hypothetical protein [Thiohalophilus sp.]